MRWLLFGSVLVLISFPAVGQTKSSNPPPSYEGQRVGSILLTANPHLETEPYRELVVQKPGEPYSNQKIQESIDALNRTGVFSKVELKVQPDPGGLRAGALGSAGLLGPGAAHRPARRARRHRPGGVPATQPAP